MEVGSPVAHGVQHPVEEAVGGVHEEAQPLEVVPLRAGLHRLEVEDALDPAEPRGEQPGRAHPEVQHLGAGQRLLAAPPGCRG